MGWKAKEKQLTYEEAIAAAKRELVQFWFGSPPLLAGVRSDGLVTAHPLSPDFPRKPWLIFFMDPTGISSESCLVYAREWHRRYNLNNLGFLLIFKPVYQYLRNPKAIEAFIHKQHIPFPLALDADELLSSAFGVRDLPRVILLNGNEVALQGSGNDWNVGLELLIQQFLRKTDPGLPLAPAYQLSKGEGKDIRRLELGLGPASTKFPEPGFRTLEDGTRIGKFSGTRPESMHEEDLFIAGTWVQDSEKIITQDPHAQIGFRSSGTVVSVVAQSASKTAEAAKVMVEIAGSPAFDSAAGENMQMDEGGEALVRVDGAGLYSVLKNLSERDREITLKFPAADRVPVAIYGIRFGD